MKPICSTDTKSYFNVPNDSTHKSTKKHKLNKKNLETAVTKDTINNYSPTTDSSNEGVSTLVIRKKTKDKKSKDEEKVRVIPLE